MASRSGTGSINWSPMATTMVCVTAPTFAFCTDPLLVDTDGDGLKDGAELQGSAEPPRADSDGDRDQ